MSIPKFIFLLELATPSLTVAFSLMFLLFLPILVYTTRIVFRGGTANDPGLRSLNSSVEDKHNGWKNQKSKHLYLAADYDALIKITQAINIQVISLFFSWP